MNYRDRNTAQATIARRFRLATLAGETVHMAKTALRMATTAPERTPQDPSVRKIARAAMAKRDMDLTTCRALPTRSLWQGVR
jgi:hypothetical protein